MSHIFHKFILIKFVVQKVFRMLLIEFQYSTTLNICVIISNCLYTTNVDSTHTNVTSDFNSIHIIFINAR